jgi:DNA adenine methylase
MPLMRYPGSKDKISIDILDRFPDGLKYPLGSIGKSWEYREPFFGAGAVGVRVLKMLSAECRVWINDIDPHVAALWRAVYNEPHKLIDAFQAMTPSPDLFYRLKAEDGCGGLTDAEAGARKMLLHAMSRSGFGAKAGGPIGGRHQTNEKYPIGCRWNPDAREAETRRLHRLFRRFASFRVTCLDFAEVIADAAEDCFIYADPPYVKAGPQLYKHAFGGMDHARLAESLKACGGSWVLSYDEHELVRELYGWANIESITLTYTCAEAKEIARRKNSEVIITPKARGRVAS